MKKLYSYHYSIMSALNHRYMRETYEIYYENDRKMNIDASLRNVKYFEVFFINIVVDINKFIIRRTKFILILISFGKLIYNNPRIIILVIFHFQKVK